MTENMYRRYVSEAMRTGAAIMPDGAQLVYNGGMFNTERYFAVYDNYGNCVETSYSALDLFYLFK